MKNISKFFALLGIIAIFSNCKSDRLLGTPEVSFTEEVILVKPFESPAPTFNDYDYKPSTTHDGYGRVPDTKITTEKISVSGQWFAATLVKTGEPVSVYIVSGTHQPGDSIKVSLREYNEGVALVGPYSPPPVATSTTQPKDAPTPKGRADWGP